MTRSKIKDAAPSPSEARAAEAAEPGELGPVLARNIRSLEQRRQAEEARRPLPEKIARRMTDFAGSMAFVCLHLGVVILWTLVNLGLVPGAPVFDPNFVILATAASVEAIFLSTFVLISQNRDAARAERRAQLDLHTNLLAEREITAIASILHVVAEKLGVEERREREIGDAERRIAPEHVLDRLDDKAG
jgi:uncharacterized membrane protein